MMIHFSVTDGRLEIHDTSDDRRLLGSFSPEDRAALVVRLADLISKGWDGRAVGGSSMNWPKDDGWPDEDLVEGFLRPAIREAARTVGAERTGWLYGRVRAILGPRVQDDASHEAVADALDTMFDEIVKASVKVERFPNAANGRPPFEGTAESYRITCHVCCDTWIGPKEPFRFHPTLIADENSTCPLAGRRIP